MFAFRSIYGRLVFTFCAVIILAFMIMAFTMPGILRDNAIAEERDTLFDKAKVVGDVYLDVYEQGDTGTLMQKSIERLSSYDEMDIVIADRFSSAVWESDSQNVSDRELAEASASGVIPDVLAGAEKSVVAYADNEARLPVVTVGVPIRMRDSIVGCVICSAEINFIDGLISRYMSQLLVSGCFMMLIAIGVAMATSRRMERPLELVASAADSIARGDFEKRVDVDRMHEMSSLAVTFNKMAEELQKYEETRSSFVANVSHELRSPLTSIQGFVQGILDGTIDEKEREQYLTIVLDETKRLNALISDLLDLAKVESGQFPLHRTEWDLNELLRQSIIKFITKIEDKGLDITVDVPEGRTMVTADKDRMTQVITNIIDNAVKYSNHDGSLSIWTTPKEGGKIEVSIKNSGEAIPEEDIPYIFDRFFKVDKSHNRKAKGTGIGLSIVWNIIVQHGERIWVNSKEGTGTVFTFTMTLAQKKQDRTPEKEQKGIRFTKRQPKQQ